MTTAPENQLASLQQKVESREARIGIVGMGYVGLPLALLYSSQRFKVTGFDIEERKVATLNAGGSYIVRILPSEIQEALRVRSRVSVMPQSCEAWSGVNAAAGAGREAKTSSSRWTRSSSAFRPRSMSTTNPT